LHIKTAIYKYVHVYFLVFAVDACWGNTHVCIT